MRNKKSIRWMTNRSGGAAVEGVLVVPLLVFVLLGSIDLAQYVNVAQSVSNASREGARVACRNSTKHVSTIQSAVFNYLSETFPNLDSSEMKDAVTITVTDETTGLEITGDMSPILSGAPLSVMVGIDFDVVRWLNGVHYWNGQFKQTTTITRRE